MKNIWVFGDSFSSHWNKTHSYYIWKGYKPKIFVDIVSEKLNIPNINLAKPGCSNDTIFDCFCENVNNIKENDIIILGWSSIGRFRLADSANNWKEFLPFQKENITFDNISDKTINEILFSRTSKLYKKELLNRINLINKAFKKNKIIHWSWDYTDLNLETITIETNGELIDNHWSENGHLQFSNWIINKINNGNLKYNELLNLI